VETVAIKYSYVVTHIHITRTLIYLKSGNAAHRDAQNMTDRQTFPGPMS